MPAPDSAPAGSAAAGSADAAAWRTASAISLALYNDCAALAATRMLADPKNQALLSAASAASGGPRSAQRAAISAPSASKALMQNSIGRIKRSNCAASGELHAPLA